MVPAIAEVAAELPLLTVMSLMGTGRVALASCLPAFAARVMHLSALLAINLLLIDSLSVLVVVLWHYARFIVLQSKQQRSA